MHEYHKLRIEDAMLAVAVGVCRYGSPMRMLDESYKTIHQFALYDNPRNRSERAICRYIGDKLRVLSHTKLIERFTGDNFKYKSVLQVEQNQRVLQRVLQRRTVSAI